MSDDYIAGRYQLIRVIGKGGTGIVYLAEDRNLQTQVVLKQITTQLHDRPGIRNEVDILKRLHHSNLPQVYDFFQYGNQVFTVFEFIEGNDLTAWLNMDGKPSGISEDVLRSWLWQLCTVLEYLHTQEPAIIHSDIKPGNIMITPEGRAMLIDFNISFLSSQAVKGYSNWYASPEQVRQAKMILDSDDISKTRLDARSDIYSLAATFYHLISGNNPVLEHKNLPLTEMKLPYSKDLLSLLDKAMEEKPSKRFRSARQMREALEHLGQNDMNYRRKLWQQLGVFACSAALITAGVVCVFTGRNTARIQKFEAGVHKAEIAYQDNLYEQMTDVGREVLEDRSLKEICRARPSQTGELCAIVGEGYFQQSRYTLAAEYYRQAYQYQNELDYFMRYAVSLIRCGQNEEAYNLLSQYQSEDGNSNCISAILQAELYCQDGAFDLALESVENCTKPPEPDIQRRLYETGAYAARAGHRWNAAAEYLKQCYAISGVGTYLKEEGECSYLAATETGDESGRIAWYTKAAECYSTYNRRYYPTDETRLQEALMLYHAGEWQKAETQLNSITEDGINDTVLFRAWMYLTFITCEYRSSGNDRIREMCRQADFYHLRLSLEDQKNYDSDWKHLMELAELVGQEVGP